MANGQSTVRKEVEIELNAIELYAILKAMIEKGIQTEVQMFNRYIGEYQLEVTDAIMSIRLECIYFDNFRLELASQSYDGCLMYYGGYADKEYTLCNFSREKLHQDQGSDFNWYKLSTKSPDISFYFWAGSNGSSEIEDIFLNVDNWVRKYINAYSGICFIGLDLESINYTKIESYGGMIKDSYIRAEVELEKDLEQLRLEREEWRY